MTWNLKHNDELLPLNIRLAAFKTYMKKSGVFEELKKREGYMPPSKAKRHKKHRARAKAVTHQRRLDRQSD